MAGVCLLVFHHSGALAATPLYWNPGGINGDGVWGTSPGEKNWNDAPGVVVGNIAWPDTNDRIAVFQDLTGGVVTLSDNLQTAGIIQNGANYTINAATITLVPDAAAANPFIHVQGGTLTIDSVLAGSGGLIKNGEGTLALTGVNTYNGNTRIENGILNLAGSLTSTSLSISSGATIFNQNGGFSNSTMLTNAGTLTLNGDDTIESYISNGGTLGIGPGTLFTATAELNDGSLVSGLLNTGTLVSNDAVSVSGTITAGSASVQSGTLDLTGTLDSNVVDIAIGASLLNQNGGLSNSAALANAGSLTLGSDDTIATYISNGGTLTAGPGTLFTTSANLNDRSTVVGLLNTGTLTSHGAVLLSGTATAGSASIQSGVFTLNGTLASNTVGISSGASLLNQNGGLSNSSTLANAGSLTLNVDDTITNYISNGGTLAAGPGTLLTTNANLNDGSTVAGLLDTGMLASNGTVSLSGTATAGSTAIQSGSFTLGGMLASNVVGISAGASLLNQSGGLSSSSTITNAGSLTMNAGDTISNYISNGGILTNGPGTLFTTTAALNHGSTLAGLLDAGMLISNGAVMLGGTATAGSASIQSGSLVLGGTLASSAVSIAGGASLINQNGGLSNSAMLANAGSLTLNSNDTITAYISNGGTLTAGAGTLFATTANLNNGSSVAGLLNTDTLASNGGVMISGIATANGTASVQSGTLDLTGTLNTPILNIANGAVLIQNGIIRSGNPSSGGTVATNGGSLIVRKSTGFRTYISNGGLLDIQGGRFITATALLNDGSTTVGRPMIAGLVTTNGSVRIENNILGARAIIATGVLDLAGNLGANSVEIAKGASLLNQNGGLNDSATLTNSGTLTLNANDTITSYISDGGMISNGPGTLFTTSAALNDGSTVAGLLNSETLTSNGAVRLSGTATAGRASIQSGTLTLTGRLASDGVNILKGASLLNQNGGLSNSATLTNEGFLRLNSDDTITGYISNGGILAAGPGTLFSSSASINAGSTVAGLLTTGSLTSNGAVQVGGVIASNSIDIRTGTLANTGTLGIASSLLNINQGATLVASGIQRFTLLTTSGAAAGTWRGDLRNPSTIAPGREGATGILAVQGNFSQTAGGMLRLDLSTMGSDRLNITGRAIFDGALVLNQLGPAAITPFVPVTVISASGYTGNFTSFNENLNGAVWFNPGNGTVTRLDVPSVGHSFFGATRNQTSTWTSLYDDVIDPGVDNISSAAGENEITSGIADTGNPDLLWALSSSFAPGGLNAALLNRLSPEVYGGVSDYAMQATRAHQRSAFSAPALEPRDATKPALLKATDTFDWEFFAAADYFRAGTDNSLNQADYDFEGMGVLTGARTRLWDQMQVALYFGADSGSISGDLINGDASGWTFGALSKFLLDEKSRTRLTAGISYGTYEFDGHRGSASATAAGWMPGRVGFDDIGVDAFDLFVGVDGVAWKKDTLTLIPSGGFRYAMSRMDAFNESTGGAPGSPIALNVSRDRHESLLFELGLMAQLEVNENLSFWGEGGFNLGLLGDGRVLEASFAKGNRPMRATADGLGDDSIYLGWRAIYQITDDIHAGLGYRADFRPDVKVQQELRISSSWRF